MRFLLDTHAFLWFVGTPERLSPRALAASSNIEADVLVSAGSAWEITTKHRLGKLPGVSVVAANVEKVILDNGFTPLPIAITHAERAGAFPMLHKDPFDRILAAQCLCEGLALISKDAALDSFGVTRLW